MQKYRLLHFVPNLNGNVSFNFTYFLKYTRIYFYIGDIGIYLGKTSM